MPPPSQVLVVVEYSRANCLLRPVLSYDVVIDPLLQVAWVELGDPEPGLVEHGAAAVVDGGIIAARESGVEILRSAAVGVSRRCRGREMAARDWTEGGATGARVGKAGTISRDHDVCVQETH